MSGIIPGVGEISESMKQNPLLKELSCLMIMMFCLKLADFLTFVDETLVTFPLSES